MLFEQSLPAAAALAAAVEPFPYVVNVHERPLDARRQGALYRITGQGQVSYLFGTVHVGTQAFYPLAPEVERALAAAGQLVVELDTRANEAFRQALLKHGNYPPGDNIRKHVSLDTMAGLTRALHGLGITVASVAHLKPWLLANMLTGLELDRHGYKRSHGLESFLLAKAQANGTAIVELESADYQLSLFDTLGDADSERYLRESLDELANGTLLEKAKVTLDAWSSGDAAAQGALIADATAGGTVLSDFTRQTLLGRRNPEMVAQIQRIMLTSKITFVGVGLLHLLGANGLPQLLSQQGYQVERMY